MSGSGRHHQTMCSALGRLVKVRRRRFEGGSKKGTCVSRHKEEIWVVPRRFRDRKQPVKEDRRK